MSQRLRISGRQLRLLRKVAKEGEVTLPYDVESVRLHEGWALSNVGLLRRVSPWTFAMTSDGWRALEERDAQRNEPEPTP